MSFSHILRANGNLRGQILSTDLVVSLSLFLGSLLVFILAWSTLTYSYYESKADTDMQSQLLAISDTLVLSQGSPSGWEFGTIDSVSSFGLANSKNELSGAKITGMQSFFGSNYTEAKVRAGAGRFDLYVSINSQDGDVLYSFGRVANFTDRQVVMVGADRLALLNDELVDVKIMLWRTKGGNI